MALNFSHDEYLMHALNHPILAVDDEELKLGEIVGIARANGFWCDFARSASEAWPKLMNEPEKYELMIIDNDMPLKGPANSNYSPKKGVLIDNEGFEFGDEGLQLLKRIRDTDKLKSLEVIVYSGADVKQQVEALGAVYIQANAYILNNMLRERSGLYKEAVKEQKKAKKGFFSCPR